LTFEFPDNSVVVQYFPGNVTLGFVRASLGCSRGVLFDRIRIEADDLSRIGDIENRTFRVTAPVVNVSWELLPDKKPKGTLGDISIFTRVIDVKHQIAKSATLDFFRCQLLLDNARLDDSATISCLGVGNTLLLSVHIRDARINRLYFVDASDRQITIDFDLAKYPTFRDTTLYFRPPADSVVAYHINGKPLKLLTPMESHIGHPERIITVLFRPSRLQIVFQEGPESNEQFFQVTPETVVADLRALTGPSVARREKRFRYIICNSRRPSDSSLVLQINPDLDPVYVRESAMFRRKAGTLYMFRYDDTSLRFPLEDGAQVATALSSIAQNLRVAKSPLSIFFEGNRLDPSASLDPTCEYAIVVESNLRSFEVVLLPLGSSDSAGVLRRNIAVDISAVEQRFTLTISCRH
jgi:hypothetical protein